MADFKDEISRSAVESIAADLRRAWTDFPAERFVAEAVEGLEALELLARVRHVAAVLRRCLPADFATAAEVMSRAVDETKAGAKGVRGSGIDGWASLPCGFWVADHGIDHPETALPLLAALTPRFSSEWPLRPFLLRHRKVTFEHLRRWVHDPDEHVRRLVSEGTRPRLPWAPVLRDVVADPTPCLELLDALYDDPSAYVRRSVANHLNDISRDHPDVAVEAARRWLESGSEEAAWTVRHGLRTLVKRGSLPALALLGYGDAAGIELSGLAADPQVVPVGGEVELRFTLEAEHPTRAVIHYVVHHAGVRGPRPPKVFKLATRSLDAGSPLLMVKRHAFREVSVRRIHPGPHRIEIQVNGRVLAGTEVTVCPPA